MSSSNDPSVNDPSEFRIPLARVTWTLPGQPIPTSVETPSLLVICAPDINKPGDTIIGMTAPTDVHAAWLVANALTILRKHYGETGVRNAIKMEASGATTMRDTGLESPVWDAPAPEVTSPGADQDFSVGIDNTDNPPDHGPIGGGRLPPDLRI